MSQAGIINVIDNNPTIPIYFEGDTGFAVALFNTIRIVGDGTNITTAAAGNTITINLAGATFEGLTPDQGAQVVPVAGNINVFGQKAGVVPVMETHNVAGNLTIEDRTWETQYVVDASTTVGLQGTYSTVQAAINQAVADGASISNQKMIYVRYGTYIEDLTIPSGIFIKGDAMVNQPGAIPLFTEIQGNHTFGDTNVFRTENIYWTNTDPTADMFSAATVIVVTAVNSVFNNGTSTGYIFTLDFNYQSFTNCIFYANGFQPIFNFTGGQANFFNCAFPQSNGMNSAANLRFYNCITVGPIVNVNGSVIAYDTSFNGSTNCITGNGSSILAYNCQFNSASDCVDYTGQLSLANCYLTNGAGENLYAANQLLQVVPAQAGQILPVETQNANFTLGDSYVNYVDTSGGAIIATLPYNTTIDKTYIIKDITGDAATNNITIQIGFPGGTIDGAATLVLDRDYGAVCLQKTRTPGEWTVLWSSADSSSFFETVTGNTGGPISPVAGNLNLVTANSTPIFAGSGSTQTLNFNLTNLALGTTMPNVTTGVANVGMGGDVASAANSPLTSITSGSGNVAIGWAAASALSSGANNVIIGQQAGKALTTGIQNNAIGSTTLLSLTTGSSNTANGQNVFPFLQTGSSNTGVGVGTGFNYNGAESSNILIANNGANGESNTLRIGSQGSGNRQVNRAFVAGIVGVTVSNTQQVTIDSTSGQLGVQSNESSLVTTYTANGTWTKNARTKTVRFLAWGGGGGGGSGRCGASGAAGGGGGGAGGGFYDMVFNGADLTASPYTVTIGVGGTGGASVNAVTTNGNPGNPGTNTTVGSFLLASGSPGGSGGTTGSGAGGTPSYMTISGITTQVATGTAGNSIAAAAGTNLQNSYATGGGGGSGYLAATPRAGGVAGSIVDQALNVLVAGGLGGSNAGATAGNGNSPVAQSLSIGGTGGGGGGNNGTSTAGAGGNGALPGGGGGGGGGNLNSNPSGAGGNGANGYLVVIEYF